MKILYVAAGSKAWGMGHLNRSLGLVDGLRKRKHSVFAAAIIPDDKKSRLSGVVKGYNRYIAKLKDLQNINAELIVVDVHTDFQPELLAWLKRKNKPVAALDWYFKREGIIKHVINLRGGSKALRYALIRKSIYQYCGKNKKLIYDAVAVLGGGDDRGYLDKLYRIFTDDPAYHNKEIILVVGPISSAKILLRTGRKGNRITVLKNPVRLPEIMSQAKVGITNGGTTLMEFTALGIPTIVFPESDQEARFSRIFISMGGSFRGTLNPYGLRQKLFALWQDDALWKNKSQQAKKLIDGGGIRLAVKEILNTQRGVRGKVG